MEQTYTVFGTGGFLASGNCDAYTLEQLIAAYERGNMTPVAWAAEATAIYGGAKSAAHLRAESIAAGRVIELVDGQYVPRGVPVETKPAATLGDQLRKVLERGKPTPTLDKLENEAEKKEPISEGIADPRFAEDETGPDDPRWSYYFKLLGEPDPRDLEMIVRDGQAKRKHYEWVGESDRAPKSTAKPALASLSRISSMSHMLGNGIRDEVR